MKNRHRSESEVQGV